MTLSEYYRGKVNMPCLVTFVPDESTSSPDSLSHLASSSSSCFGLFSEFPQKHQPDPLSQWVVRPLRQEVKFLRRSGQVLCKRNYFLFPSRWGDIQLRGYSWWCSRKSEGLSGSSCEGSPQIQAPPNSNLSGRYCGHEALEVSKLPTQTGYYTYYHHSPHQLRMNALKWIQEGFHTVSFLI